MSKLQSEIVDFLEQWTGAIVRRDRAASIALRTPDSVARYPTRLPLGPDDEIAFIHENLHGDVEFHTRDLSVEEAAGGATATFLLRLRMAGEEGQPTDSWAKCRMELVRDEGRNWLMRTFEARLTYEMIQAAVSRPVSSIKRRILRKIRGPQVKPATFQQLAFLPNRAGENYLVEPRSGLAPPAKEADLPIPPQELWLGYNYPAHGAAHVETMLEIVAASGFTFAGGDRILDLGCGAGRMIRHLFPYTGECEVWGCDISSEHIQWCKQNLSPPFHFFTNTKVPHLPFADGSFRFIYCGSLFTHIDDLADAWMLEIRRIMAPGGRLFATIHDEHTFRILDTGGGPPDVLQHVCADPLFETARQGFDMFTVGRDDLSQVFVSRDYFARMAGPGLEVLSVTPEAYFYQTAILLGAK